MPSLKQQESRKYSTCDGVPKDAVAAYAWFNLAASASYFMAAEEREHLARTMTNAQIAEAQTVSRRLVQSGEANDVPGHDATAATGSGFFVSSTGYFVTCAHVVDGGRRFDVHVGRLTFAARVVGRDVANDLALLKCDGTFVALPLRSSASARLGDRIATLGFPNPDMQGTAPKFARGEIAALSGTKDDPRYFQVSLPIQPGNSGGPLLDFTGAVIGVVAAQLDQRLALEISGALHENVNYAVKGSHLLAFLESERDLDATIAHGGGKPLTDADIATAAERACGLVLVHQR